MTVINGSRKCCCSAGEYEIKKVTEKRVLENKVVPSALS